MVKKTIRYTALANDPMGWELYYALSEQIDGELRMWVENDLIVMEYDSLISFDEIWKENS